MIKQLAMLALAGAATVASGAARAQPYPGQPYPGQPYPAQPYPAPPYAAPGQVPPGAPDVPPGQMPPQMAAMMHLAARNQLGVLEYCQAQGYVGPDVIALQRQQIAALPPTQVQGLAQAEAVGRQGTVDAGGRQTTLAQAAQAHGTSVAELCEQVGAMLRQQSAELQGGAPEQAPRP